MVPPLPRTSCGANPSTLYTRVQQFDFFRKYKTQTLGWVKNGIPHIYKIRFLIFLAAFVGFKICKKCYNEHKHFIWKIQERYQKSKNFLPISNPLKKLQKNAPKTDLMNMSKSGKVHVSVTFLIITFSYKIFSSFSHAL